ncbi:HAMP domain-containing protein [Pleomorphomonas koreensis]|uniref:HAMP domain-containing protein n=1 Tax=Pleomorphomonas koreensis TaxID=257440 RepID=UPI00146A1026|nr:HAMP domain-containing protein [Pleomorphomonas koreensis]
MKRMKTLWKTSPVEMAAPRRPRGLSLQAIVVAIFGLMLVVLQLAIGVTETVRQLDGIKSDAVYRATAGLDLLAAIPTENRNDRDAKAVLGIIRSLSDIYTRNHPGESISVETVTAAGDQPPGDTVVWGDNDLRILRAFAIDDGAASVTGFFEARIDLAADYARWYNDIRDRAQLAAFIVLSVLMLAVLLMRVTVVSPLERLSGLTRRLASGELVEVPEPADRAREICDLSEALVVFRNNLVQKDAL